MRKQDVLGGLRQLSDDVSREQGMSIAQCEFWSDTMDRWAEDLVDPACSGACPGCRCKGSLPPSIVLEVLQILEGEINLREETRVAEQAKAAVEAKKHVAEAKRLSVSQTGFQDRVVKVVERIRALPDGDADFAKEIALLGQVSTVMKDATKFWPAPKPARRQSQPKRKRSSSCSNRSESIPTAAAAAAQPQATAAEATRKTLRLAMFGAGRIKKKSAKAPARNNRSAKPAPCGPRVSRRLG